MPDVSKGETGTWAAAIATLKDLVALLTNSLLLLLGILLLLFPTKLNSLLTDAGFEEGSIVGFKWKAGLVDTTRQLTEALAKIKDLEAQNEKLLAEARSTATTPQAQARVQSLEDSNRTVLEGSARVTSSAQGTISANAALVAKAAASLRVAGRPAVIFGGDRTLAEARYETETVAPKLGITRAAIYLRQGMYRSVAPASDAVEAARFLDQAKARRPDAYTVNLDTWCPNPVARDGYFECVESRQ